MKIIHAITKTETIARSYKSGGEVGGVFPLPLPRTIENYSVFISKTRKTF
jgi:hypothetical protein